VIRARLKEHSFMFSLEQMVETIMAPTILIRNKANRDKKINKDNLLKIQTKNLLRYLYSLKPEYKQFDLIIESNMMHHFDVYFKLLSALDIYNITSKLATFVKSDKVKSISSKSLQLVENINKLANYYITTALETLIKTSNFLIILEMDWPLLSIIKEIFQDNLSKDKSDDTIVYNYRV
jgi:hypothetical protein